MVLKHSPSGVSIAIQNTMAFKQQAVPLIDKLNPAEFTVKIANTLQEREDVFQLGYQVYLEKGYIKENPYQWLVQDYDRVPETTIFIVKDRAGEIAGTATLVFNSSTKLPIEKTFGSEIKTLSPNGAKVTEVSRLVINPTYRNSKEILVLLFNYMFIYGYHIKNVDLVAIQVNPRHKNYYKKLLNFDESGEEKLCASVQNAPASLLYMPLINYQMEVKRCHQQNLQENKNRSLYSYFIKPEQENLVSYYLKSQAKPISAEEKIYFGFSETTFGRAVCV